MIKAFLLALLKYQKSKENKKSRFLKSRFKSKKDASCIRI